MATIKYIFKRLVAGMLSPFILITTTFFLMHVIPGGPFNPSKQRNVSEKILEQIPEKYNLNGPLPAQYVRHFGNLFRGDTRTSFKKQGITVNELIANSSPVSAKVGALGITVVPAARIPLGIVVAVKRGKLANGASMVLAIIGMSVPSFMFYMLMMYVFYEKWKIFPSYGLTSWKHYVLPVLYMAFSQVAYITRFMRSSMLETVRQDYIRTERFRGVPGWGATGKYTLKSSVLPVVTYVGLLVAALLIGTSIIEKLFNISGLGRCLISTIMNRDYSVTLGLTVFLGVMVIGCNLIVDIMYAVIDPKIRTTE